MRRKISLVIRFFCLSKQLKLQGLKWDNIYLCFLIHASKDMKLKLILSDYPALFQVPNYAFTFEQGKFKRYFFNSLVYLLIVVTSHFDDY